VYYHVFPELLPAEFRESGMSDSVFPYFIVHALPVGVSGLLVASIFAAGMSTISTSLNAGATVLLNDFYRRFRSQTEESESVTFLYIASALICVLGTLVSFYIIRVESALDVWWNLAGIFSGGMLGLFLLGFFSSKVSNVPAAVGVAVGLLTIAWMSLSPTYFTGALETWQNPLHNYMTIVVGTLVIFLVGFLLTLLLPGASRDTPKKGNS